MIRLKCFSMLALLVGPSWACLPTGIGGGCSGGGGMFSAPTCNTPSQTYTAPQQTYAQPPAQPAFSGQYVAGAVPPPPPSPLYLPPAGNPMAPPIPEGYGSPSIGQGVMPQTEAAPPAPPPDPFGFSNDQPSQSINEQTNRYLEQSINSLNEAQQQHTNPSQLVSSGDSSASYGVGPSTFPSPPSLSSPHSLHSLSSNPVSVPSPSSAYSAASGSELHNAAIGHGSSATVPKQDGYLVPRTLKTGPAAMRNNHRNLNVYKWKKTGLVRQEPAPAQPSYVYKPEGATVAPPLPPSPSHSFSNDRSSEIEQRPVTLTHSSGVAGGRSEAYKELPTGGENVISQSQYERPPLPPTAPQVDENTVTQFFNEGPQQSGNQKGAEHAEQLEHAEEAENQQSAEHQEKAEETEHSEEQEYRPEPIETTTLRQVQVMGSEHVAERPHSTEAQLEAAEKSENKAESVGDAEKSEHRAESVGEEREELTAKDEEEIVRHAEGQGFVEEQPLPQPEVADRKTIQPQAPTDAYGAPLVTQDNADAHADAQPRPDTSGYVTPSQETNQYAAVLKDNREEHKQTVVQRVAYRTYYNQVCHGEAIGTSKGETITSAADKCALLDCAAANAKPMGGGKYEIVFLRKTTSRSNQKGMYCVSGTKVPLRSARYVRQDKKSPTTTQTTSLKIRPILSELLPEYRLL